MSTPEAYALGRYSAIGSIVKGVAGVRGKSLKTKRY